MVATVWGLLAWAWFQSALGAVPPRDILEVLQNIPGVVAKEITTEPVSPSYRRFEVQITQPVDHFSTNSPTFQQRLVLLHRDLAAPMILQTSGYKIFAVALSGLAQTFEANQIQVEHRFFDRSVPDLLEWKYLDIRQSAHDFHRIVQAFKAVYPQAWVNTGASKGGMTSAFHHRFFPQDLNGTVSDVAPLSFSTEDPRYIDFVDTVGGVPYTQCRQDLEDLQKILLEKRKEILAGIQGQFTYIGGKSVALEHAVIELPFVFWQYKNPLDPSIGCGHIPGANATVKELRAYLEVVNPVSGLGDLDLLTFMPYYFQAATQLGAPGSKLSHLSGLKQHPYHLGQYTPPGVPIHYSNEAMKDIDAWTRKEADKIMFVYGELDPWTAAAFPDTDGAKDFHRFFVPGGNHGSKLFALTPKDREKAIAVVARWLGKAIPAGRLDLEATLEDAEFEFRSKHHVR